MKTELLKAYKFRLYPNKEQTILLNKTFGSNRFLFNNMLAERKEVYKTFKATPKKLSKYKYKTEKQYKEEFVWLKEVDSVSLQQSRVDLQTAYINFFKSKAGKRKGKKVGYPKFKSKHSNNYSYRTLNINNNITINFEDKKLKLPKLKHVKYKDTRTFNGEIRNVTVSKTPTGKYYASILVRDYVEINQHRITSDSKSIGLDYSSKELFVSHENQISGYPKFYRLYEKKLKKYQRRLSRKVKGSNNWNKQRIKVAKIHEKIVNSRKDFQQKLSTDLVRKYDIIGVESLSMVGISRSLNLAKSTLDNSWGSFLNMLEYKCDWKGKYLIKADRFFASSKLCNVCGYKNTELTLSERNWVCPDCKTDHNRDVNAGLNIRNFALNKIKNTVGTTEIHACGDFSSGEKQLNVSRETIIGDTRITLL